VNFKPWMILQNREVYSAPPYLRVDVQQVELPDGTVIDDYHHWYLEHHNSSGQRYSVFGKEKYIE
jgi:hypothetical protein